MNCRIGRIGPLTRIVSARIFAANAIEHFLQRSRFQQLVIVDQHDFRPELTQDIDFVFADRITQVKLRPIALCGSNSRNTNAGISARQIYQKITRLNLTCTLGIPNYPPCCTVFDAASRIEIFDFCQKPHRNVIAFLKA